MTFPNLLYLVKLYSAEYNKSRKKTDAIGMSRDRQRMKWEN
jgi:hypothetical protein